jgi:hypothetical protein
MCRVEQARASKIEGIFPAKGFLVANARHERPGPERSRMTAVGKYATTRAPQLASYGPDVLKAIGEAFDEAWAEIVGNFGNEPQAKLPTHAAILDGEPCLIDPRLISIG